MRRRKFRRSIEEEDTDPNLVPIMNMFMVLIPFLMMSASFYHIRAINTSIPVMADSGSPVKPEKNNIKVTAIVELKDNHVNVSAMSSDLSEELLDSFRFTFSGTVGKSYPYDKLAEYFNELKSKYPASDTIVIIPDDIIKYETIIHAMDVARKTEENDLFPNVVISGSLG